MASAEGPKSWESGRRHSSNVAYVPEVRGGGSNSPLWVRFCETPRGRGEPSLAQFVTALFGDAAYSLLQCSVRIQQSVSEIVVPPRGTDINRVLQESAYYLAIGQ